MSLVPPDPELNPIESALGRLAPARSRIDRDRLMFQAGVNSAQSEVPAPLGLALDRGHAGCRGAVGVRRPGGQARRQALSWSSSRHPWRKTRPSSPSRSRS